MTEANDYRKRDKKEKLGIKNSTNFKIRSPNKFHLVIFILQTFYDTVPWKVQVAPLIRINPGRLNTVVSNLSSNTAFYHNPPPPPAPRGLIVRRRSIQGRE